jgi:hypothetical protein
VTDCALGSTGILDYKFSGCRVLYHHGCLLRVTPYTDINATRALDKVSHQVQEGDIDLRPNVGQLNIARYKIWYTNEPAPTARNETIGSRNQRGNKTLTNLIGYGHLY